MTAIRTALKKIDSFAWGDSCDKENVQIILEELIDKEKQQIIEAYINGGISDEIYFSDNPILLKDDAIQYYNSLT